MKSGFWVRLTTVGTAVGTAIGLLGLAMPLTVLAQPASPTFSPQQQAFLDELKARVSSRLYQSRVRNQPGTYVEVGEGACQEIRERGYEAVVRKQNQVSRIQTLRLQPQGNNSYRGQLQVQMGRTVIEAARKHLCPDAPERK
jgi:hypothetical protein